MDIDPNLDISSFSHTHLYDHKFDVDDIIHALCHVGDASFTGRLLLNTKDNALILDTGTHADLTEGSLDGHIFEITPLPLESFKNELKEHMLLQRLNDEDQTTVLSHIESCTHIADFPTLFGEAQAGGWLRERVKEQALEWLDARGLIPPSMTHVYDAEQFSAPPSRTQIQFTEE